PKPGAGDGSARDLARAAQSEAESIAADHRGSYARVGLLRLHKDNPSIVIRRSAAGAWLSAASGTAGSYTISATAEPTGDTYTVTRLEGGRISRTCSLAKRLP